MNAMANFEKERLRSQLKTLGVQIFNVKKFFLSLSSGQATFLSQVRRLLQLILVMPATNATSEGSFSALHHCYLRTTMWQDRLNYLMAMHVHKERTDLKVVLSEFISGSEHRSGIFAKYWCFLSIT